MSARRLSENVDSGKKPGPVVVVTPADPAKELLQARPGFLVRRLNQIHYSLFFEECKSQNITPVQYGILTVLSVLPELDQTSLAEEVGLDRTTTADVVKRLEDRGLIVRKPNPADRRARLARLTPAGRKMVDLLRPNMQRAQEQLLEPLKPAERMMFMHLLTILVEANNEHSRTVLRIL